MTEEELKILRASILLQKFLDACSQDYGANVMGCVTWNGQMTSLLLTGEGYQINLNTESFINELVKDEQVRAKIKEKLETMQ